MLILSVGKDVSALEEAVCVFIARLSGVVVSRTK